MSEMLEYKRLRENMLFLLINMEHVSKFAKLSFPNNFLISCRIYNKEGVTKILKNF